MKTVSIAALARDELGEAVEWYDSRAPTQKLGRQLVEAIDLVTESIAENPRRFPLVHRDIRRALLRRFPYGIFFRERSEDIVVIAIVHLQRHPSTWRRRV